MSRYIVRRVIYSLIGVLLVSSLVFALIQLAPGGPTILLGEELSETDRQELMRSMGLDKPMHVRYWRWLVALFHGDLGFSFTAGESVLAVIMRRLPNTVLLAGVSLAVSCLIAIPVGIIAATRRYSIMDYIVTFFSFLGISMPGVWLALMLITLFAVKWGLLPSAGMASIGVSSAFYDRLLHLILPTLTLSTGLVGEIARYARSAMLNVMSEDYVRTARAKGLAERIVMYRHALRNAMIPVITVIGGIVSSLMGGAAITETIFAWPGMGRLVVEAAQSRDYPVVVGVVVVISILTIGINLIVDITYGWLDPRVRLR
jgi:peptide/nickel transport system permease protein